MIERLHFSTRVLGPVAAYRLEKQGVTQTLRSESDSITESILSGRVSAGDRLDVVLDGVIAGRVELLSMDTVNWEYLNLEDAQRGGFDTLADLEQGLKRAGYRFKGLNQYDFFRIQFRWLEEVYA